MTVAAVSAIQESKTLSKTQQHYYRKLPGCYLRRHHESWFIINQHAFDSDIVQVLSITFMSLPPRL